ncbi:MAG: fimbrillin family protein [Bacteroidales bacterium]|nr:fimbrillin family protein [Bacteroidales bacterium]
MKQNHSLWNMAVALLACAGFVACSQDALDDGQNNSLPDGKYPLLLSASVAEAVPTRTAGKNSWTGDGTEYIGVRIGTDGNIGKYVIGANDLAEPASIDQTIYWQSTDPTYVKAWYPYATQNPVDISNQSGGFADIDFLTATAENQSYNQPVKLIFLHQMAKVSYTLVPGDGITANDLESATVSIAGYTQANFSEGTLTEGTEEGWITPTSDGEALLVPQDMTDKPFIKVSISGTDFIYTPGTGAANLQPGTRYAYTITVKADAIDVTVDVTGSDEWIAGGEATVGSKTVLVRYIAEDVKKGDYLYTDGTTSDGGLRTVYTDGSMVSLSGADKPQPVTGKTVAGIVFWTPSETSTVGRLTPASLTYDRIMAAEHPSCTHGLAVAVKTVTYNGSSEMRWQDPSEYIVNFQRNEFTHNRKSDFYEVHASDVTNNTSLINRILGYQNTVVLLAYNEYCTDNGKGDYIVHLAEAIAEFRQNATPAPAGSTGWFLPSLKELHLLCYKDVDDIYNQNNRSYTYTRNLVNASLSAAGGDNLRTDKWYWASTEITGSWAWILTPYNARVDVLEKYNISPMVRAVCAF